MHSCASLWLNSWWVRSCASLWLNSWWVHSCASLWLNGCWGVSCSSCLPVSSCLAHQRQRRRPWHQHCWRRAWRAPSWWHLVLAVVTCGCRKQPHLVTETCSDCTGQHHNSLKLETHALYRSVCSPDHRNVLHFTSLPDHKSTLYRSACSPDHRNMLHFTVYLITKTLLTGQHMHWSQKRASFYKFTWWQKHSLHFSITTWWQKHTALQVRATTWW